MAEPDGKFVGVVRRLLFEGHLLTYDPTYNVTEWVLVCGTVGDLSPTEDSLAWELSNITLLEVPDDISWMEQFGEHRLRPAPVEIPSAATTILEAEMGWVSLVAESSADVCLVECSEGAEPMYPNTMEVASMQELETMDVEPQEEISGEPAGPGVQMLGPQAPSQVEEQSASKEVVGGIQGPIAGDEPTQEKQVVDDSLVEGDAAMEEPAMEAPPTGEELAAEHPTLGCEWPPDTQEEDRVEVHAPEDDPDVPIRQLVVAREEYQEPCLGEV